MVGFILQRIQYSKRDSDIIAKMKGTYTERPKRTKEDEERANAKKNKKEKPAVPIRQVFIIYYRNYTVIHSEKFITFVKIILLQWTRVIKQLINFNFSIYLIL